MVATKSFDNLETEQFRQKMRPAAHEIYKKVFPECWIEEIRTESPGSPHMLDKYFGIDALLRWEGGFLTLQEKYRKNYAMRWMDFTQEYKNGYQTSIERDGEWHNLAAQIYFYGWANRDETYFERWVILNVATYKSIIKKAGGIEKIGKINKNSRHGKAVFYSIPIVRLQKAFIACCLGDSYILSDYPPF